MQAVKSKLATLKAKLQEAENAAQAAQDELDDCNKQADQAEEKVFFRFLQISSIMLMRYKNRFLLAQKRFHL